MRILRLAHNKLTYLGSLGMDLAPKLKILDISNNRLISLEGVKECVRLSSLNASNNQIQDASMIGNLQKLKHLDLSNNKLTDTGSLCQNINNLKQLRSLNVSHN
jgi:Leucine-rich repeat (LRR) protein